MLKFYNDVKKKTEELKADVSSLYEDIIRSRDEREQALNAARRSIPDMQDLIDRHGRNTFLKINDLFLITKV